jgi:MYXO-CTERM domain-containing protein
MKKIVGMLAVVLLTLSVSFAQNSSDQTSTTSARSGTTSVTRPDDSAPRDHNWGWIGLLGLAGLGGLRGRREVVSTTRNSGDVRRAA